LALAVTLALAVFIVLLALLALRHRLHPMSIVCSWRHHSVGIVGVVVGSDVGVAVTPHKHSVLVAALGCCRPWVYQSQNLEKRSNVS
jgi:tellurite resistance protein TehA-like permease